MTASDLTRIKKNLESRFNAYRESHSKIKKLLHENILSGKIYEAYVLSHLTKMLKRIENLHVVLFNDSNLTFQSSPGRIKRDRPHFRLYRTKEAYDHDSNSHVAEVWTDIEFLTMSYKYSRRTKPTAGDYHELDVAITKPNVEGRPSYEDILLATECKNTVFKKSHLRETLGIRRELGVLTSEKTQTAFLKWPLTHVKTNPGSILLVYGTDEKIESFKEPGTIHSIEFHYLEMK